MNSHIPKEGRRKGVDLPNMEEGSTKPGRGSFPSGGVRKRKGQKKAKGGGQ